MNDITTLVAARVAMPANEYHALDRLSSSGCKQIERSPAHFQAWRAKPSEPTPAMQFGTLVHAAILEPDTLTELCVVKPNDAPDKRSKAGKEWWEAFEAAVAGKIILADADYIRLLSVRDAVQSHPLYSAIRNEAATVEDTLLWQDRETGAACKARLDLLADDCSFVLDVKTTVDARPSEFASAAVRYGYDIQAAWYSEAVEVVTGQMPRFFFLAVETEAPFGVQLMRAAPDFLLRGYQRMRNALGTYARCVASGEWPSYSPVITDLVLPGWARRETQSFTFGE
jgi:exodeoxyribonuclease VIII